MSPTTDNNNEFVQPLIPPPVSSSSSSIMGGRILDRDGTFSQSRGRWSVSNTVSSSQSRHVGSGARQRRPVSAASSTANVTNNNVPYGVAPPATSSSLPQRPPRPPPSLWDHLLCRVNGGRCCCSANGSQAITPRRCWDDWFHTLSYTPTCILMLGVFVAYFITIVIFAGLYLTVNKVGVYYNGHENGGGDDLLMMTFPAETTHEASNYLSLGAGATSTSTTDGEVSSFCGMDINNHMEALYFSLSTMATIGYGTSDYYFGECWTPFILVLFQVFSAIVFSSLAIGLLFQRMSRGQKRGRTIVFSDVAVIRKVRGRWYWMFRVAELRKRHIIGAKIRVFCVRHERCPVAIMTGGEQGGSDAESGGGNTNVVELETAHFVSHPLPLLNGSRTNPTTARGSPPPTSLSSINNIADEEEEPNPECAFEQSILMGLPHVIVHRMDSLSPMVPPRPVWYDEVGVPHGPSVAPLATVSEAPTESTAGESATGEGTTAATSLLMEEGRPAMSSLLQPSSNMASSSPDQPTQEEIIHFLQDRQAEVICFLEGTCEVTGMALQARHSYRMEDIAFHHTFAPCVFPAGSAQKTDKGKWWNPLFGKTKAKVDHDSKAQLGRKDEMHNFGNAALEVDFSTFHDLLPAAYDSLSCPYIPSSSLRKR